MATPLPEAKTRIVYDSCCNEGGSLVSAYRARTRQIACTRSRASALCLCYCSVSLEDLKSSSLSLSPECSLRHMGLLQSCAAADPIDRKTTAPGPGPHPPRCTQIELSLGAAHTWHTLACTRGLHIARLSCRNSRYTLNRVSMLGAIAPHTEEQTLCAYLGPIARTAVSRVYVIGHMNAS